MSTSLDLDQARHFVGPDLGPNCLQRLSADDTSRQRVNDKTICHSQNPISHECIAQSILTRIYCLHIDSFIPSDELPRGHVYKLT